MKKISGIIGIVVLSACGSGGPKGENSDLGSLEVKTSLPTEFLPTVSKVEILALAKGEQDESKAAVFTLPSLNAQDAAISFAAGQYEFAAKVYQNVDGKDVILARSIKDSAECPNVTATIQGGAKTQIAISVCITDRTKPIDKNGTGSGSLLVAVQGFLPLLNCKVESKPGAVNNYKSLGIDVKLASDNVASNFRMTIGQQNSVGVTETYAATLKVDPNFVLQATMNTKFQVLNQTGGEIGIFLLRAHNTGVLNYSLTMNDGNKSNVLMSDSVACSYVVEKPSSFSLYNFFRGQ